MKKFFSKLVLGKPSPENRNSGSYLQRQKQNILAIWENEHHDDVGLEKIIRLLLASSQFLFPGSYVKHVFEKQGVVYKDIAVDVYVLFKVLLPLILLTNGMYRQDAAVLFQAWLVCETILYIPTLVFASDNFAQPRSYRRSMLMVFLNYIEIILAFALFYAHGNQLNHSIDHWFDAVYFSFSSASTMGFGDYYPVTALGKFLVCLQAMLFLLFVAIFLNMFSSKIEGKGYFEKRGHVHKE